MVPAQKVKLLAPQEAKPSADLERNPRGEKVSANPKEEKNEAEFRPERVKTRLGLEPCNHFDPQTGKRRLSGHVRQELHKHRGFGRGAASHTADP